MVICLFFKDFNIFRSRLLKSPLPSRDNQVRWHTETNYGHLPLFEDFNVFRSRLLKSSFPSRDNPVYWHAKTNYGHLPPFRRLQYLSIKTIKVSFAFQRQSSPLAHRDNLWSFVSFSKTSMSFDQDY